MKSKYYLIVILSLVFFTNSYGQTTFPNFDDLFIVNQQVYNIGNFKPVWSSENISSNFAVEFEEEQILGINSIYRLLFFDKNGEEIGDVALDNAYVSPTLEYVLTIREQDFWIQDVVNFKTLSTPRRLTNLGNITNIIILHWSENMLYFKVSFDGVRYVLNIATKELSKFDGDYYDLPKGNLYYNPTGGISPNGTFALSKYYPETSRKSSITRFEGHAVYNFDKGQHIKYPPVTPEFGILNTVPIWISPDTFFVFATSAAETSALYDQWLAWKGVHKEDGNLEILKSYNTPFQGVDSKVDFLTHFNGRSRCVSPNGKYFLYFVNRKLTGGGREINIFNLETEENQVLFSSTDEQDFDKNSMVSSWFTAASFRWISSTKFIYTTDGDLLSQGTWVFDVETKEKKKVSSFVSQKFLVFETSGYVLLNANGKLFRLDSNGENLEEMPGISNVSKYSKFYKLIR